MAEYRIIDAHTHIYPQSIAERAGESIGKFYDIDMFHLGTAEELIKSGRRINSYGYLVCSAATTPKQVESINNFIAVSCEAYKEFIGFGTMHPDYANMSGELERIKGWAKGVKLHPDFQEFFADEPRAISMWKTIAENDMFALVHLGDDRRSFSDPRRMAAVLEQVPKLKLIAAHFGGYRQWEIAFDAYKPNSCWFDISSSIMFMEKELVFKFFDKFGIENFFWGTDFPSQDHKIELERFLELGLSEEQNAMILGENLARVLGI